MVRAGAQTLVDLLAESGIMLKSYRAGDKHHIRCPKCEGGRTKEASLSVSIDADGDGAKWHCHRGSCGWKDGGRVWHPGESARRAPPPPAERVIEKPAAHAQQPRPPALYAFFEKRGIGPDTVDHFGCYIAQHWFPGTGDPEGPPEQYHAAKEYPAIVFPYVWQGELRNRKYRPPHKNPQMQDKNALPTLFNVDALVDAEVVWWVEGEPDVMALHEVGYKAATSLKDGAPAELRDEDDPTREDDKRFTALQTHAELLNGVKRFILAGDMDEPGRNLREELARRLGRHRCWLVTWPEGCKDAGDVLRIHGREAVMDAIERAEAYPIEGLQKIRSGTLLALRHGKPPPILTTGTHETDMILRFPGEGRLIVITGIPNHGKSTWLLFVMIHLMVTHRRRFAVFSPEMQPWEHFAALASAVFMGKAFWPRKGLDPSKLMDDTEIAHAESWLRDRMTMIVSDAEETPPTLDWLLDRARMSVVRDGTTDLVLDPWNEVDHNVGDMSEVVYLGRALQKCKAFGFRHGVNIWVVAHPKMQQPSKPNSKKLEPPFAYEISGGAMWANKTDVGLTVHVEDGITQIHLWKPRFRRWGKRGSMAKIEFDEISGRFRSPAGSLLSNIDEPPPPNPEDIPI